MGHYRHNKCKINYVQEYFATLIHFQNPKHEYMM
jgi:hypothetical protein